MSQLDNRVLSASNNDDLTVVGCSQWQRSYRIGRSRLLNAIEEESASSTANVLGAFQRQRLVAKKSVSRQGETGGNVLSRN